MSISPMVTNAIATSTRSASPDRCHLCGQVTLDEVAGYAALRRVTSDCRSWPAGGRLSLCRTCGGVQKVADDAWLREVATLYAGYQLYHQGQGAEQSVFSPSGHAASRSSRLVEAFCGHTALPSRGRLLDIGCGNGALLRAFGRAQPQWTLAGVERDDRHRAAVETIAGVEALFTCPPDQVPGRFDVISLIHVLEHIPQPEAFLVTLRDKFTDSAWLLVETPDCLQNPFDLLIADHCTHFTAATVGLLLDRAGYAVSMAASDWLPKELTVIARPAANLPTAPVPLPSASTSRESLERDLAWLTGLAPAARDAAARGPLGLFGTGIGATWLVGELEDAVCFFVDEDPHRAGRPYLGRPVYHPDHVPLGSHVLIALPPRVAAGIRDRLTRPGVAYYAPAVRCADGNAVQPVAPHGLRLGERSAVPPR